MFFLARNDLGSNLPLDWAVSTWHPVHCFDGDGLVYFGAFCDALLLQKESNSFLIMTCALCIRFISKTQNVAIG